MTRRRRAVSLLVFAVVAVAVVSSLAVPGGAAGNESTPTGPTASELTEGGERPANAPPSVRASGTYGEYALKYLPTGLWVDDEIQTGDWEYLEPGDEVKRDTVNVWSKRGYGLEGKDVTIRVAHFSIVRENGSRRVRNLSRYSVDATLSGGYDYVPLDLRSHYDRQVKTVICIEEPAESNCLEEPNGARWHLEHHSSPANQAIEIDSEGEKFAWGLGFLLFPMLGSALSFMFGARKAIERAKSSPRIPWWIYIVGVVGSIIGLFAAWDQVVATAIRAPWAASIIGGAVLGLVAAVWFGDDRLTALFLRFRASEWSDSPPKDDEARQAAADGGTVDASSDEGGRPSVASPGRASSSIVIDAFPIPMVRGANGDRYHVANGFWNWIARARGALAALRTRDDSKPIQTRVEVDQGPYEEAYILDPEESSEDVLDYDPEGHRWEVPRILWKDEDGWHFNGGTLLSGAIVFALLSLAGKILLASSALGLLLGGVVIAVWKFAEPDDGHLEVSLASVHYRRALPFVLRHVEAITEASTTDTLFENWTEAEIDNRLERRELEDKRDRSRMDRLIDKHLGGGELENGSDATGDADEGDESGVADD